MGNTRKQQKSFREAEGQQLRAAFFIERADSPLAVDEEESGRIDLSFASNNPIRHWFGYLELDMKETSVKLDRLNQGGALLWNHQASDQIGVIESVSLDNAGKARASVKFSRSQMGQENYRDCLDGIKRNVSVGFIPYTIEQKVDPQGKPIFENEEPVYISRDWEPFEISLVSIPADISVGVGRALVNFEEQIMDNNPIIPTETVTAPSLSVPAVAEPNPTLARIDHFIAIGERFNRRELAQHFAADPAKTEADLIRAIGEAIPASQLIPAAAAEISAGRQGQPVQLARILPRYGKLKNFKGEGAAERAYRFGMWFMGGPIGSERAAQWCKENGVMLRTQDESQNEKGGFLVPEEVGNDLIDLREQFGIFRQNAKVVPMATDTRTDPRRTGGPIAYFVGESASITASDKTWDRVSLVAKKLSVLARISSEVSEDASINIADDLAGEIGYAFAQKEDDCGFNGDGTSTYGGIVGVRDKLKGLSGTIANISGLYVGAGNAYSELLLTDFEAVVGLLPQYADTPGAKWFCHRSFYYNVMVKLMLASGGVTAAEVEGSRTRKFLGYEVAFSQVLPKTETNSQVCALLGDLSLAASLGSRRETTIAMSEHSRFSNDEIEIKGTERFDINVHDVGNATATAADKAPGPLVGLITAAS